jgi:hypothetical protein
MTDEMVADAAEGMSQTTLNLDQLYLSRHPPSERPPEHFSDVSVAI